MNRRAFDRKIAAVEALRTLDDPAAQREQLRTALKDRNNYIVARAATIAACCRCDDLIDDLLAAFDRFFIDPAKSDPQCLAKSAIAKALRDLAYHNAEPYQRGILHVQLEPTWGGRADSAGTLRGTCALALSECPLDDIEILTYLADALADPEKLVRIDSAVAIHQLSRREGALLLRLKLLTGDPEPDVMGQCFAALISLATDGAVTFVSRFLKSADETIQLEAASALAQSHDQLAIELLTEFWREPVLSLELRRALLLSLGASPLPEAAELLLTVIVNERVELASSAVAALASSRFHATLQPRITAAVEARNNPELRRAFERHFG